MALITCPECGKEISNKSKSCVHCGYPIQSAKYQVVIMGYHGTDTSACAGISETFNSELEYDQVIKIFNNCPYVIIECDELDKASVYAMKLQKWGIDIKIINPNGESEYINKNIVYCPKCGYTNIQIIPRKWSILTGIFTNKTDRVCVKCKHKW